MKIKFLFIPIALMLFSCTNNTEEITSGLPKEEVDNLFLNVTDSIDKNNNLTHLQYQDLTAWGTIEVWYLDSEIMKIETVQTDKLGFIKQIHFYKSDTTFDKSIEITDESSLKEYEKSFGRLYKVGPNKIITIDGISETYAYNSYIGPFGLRMLKNSIDLYNFISNKNRLLHK